MNTPLCFLTNVSIVKHVLNLGATIFHATGKSQWHLECVPRIHGFEIKLQEGGIYPGLSPVRSQTAVNKYTWL